MPYIDSTPQDYPIKFEEDNLQDMFGQMLTDNGWVLVRSFYKAAIDPRAYTLMGEYLSTRPDDPEDWDSWVRPERNPEGRVNYAIAKHYIFKNSDGKYLGFATIGQFTMRFELFDEIPVRRPGDSTDKADMNYGISTSWETWVKERYAETVAKTSLYFYMVEKLPSSSLAPDGGIASIVTAPGMSGTSYLYNRDKDRENWNQVYNYDPAEVEDDGDAEFEGTILEPSPFHMSRSALDVEVYSTIWNPVAKEVMIKDIDPRVMQSPTVKTILRAEFLEKMDKPLYHTNWWTDSEVRVRGYVDSRTIFLILQADNAPTWEKNLVPTIPLYFGKINSLDGDRDEGYALFAGTIPSAKRVDNSKLKTTTLVGSLNGSGSIVGKAVEVDVLDASLLPEPPALLSVNGVEIVKLIAKDGNTITVQRGQLGTPVTSASQGSLISRLSTNNSGISNATVVSLYDFDDPGATVGDIIQPLLKTYPNYPSNGVDTVMVSKSRFGARYQSHYLSWNTASNHLPPGRASNEGLKYPKSYEPFENSGNYKYQFNASRYSNKIHSSRIFVVHPEEGVRGYLDKAIGFNSQSVNASNLRLRKADCPTKIFEMYKYLSIGAVSPLTKVPATPYRPIGLGIYSEDFDPNAEPLDLENDATPPGEATITKAESKISETLDIIYEVPEDTDFKHVNVYVDEKAYAKGVSGTDFFRITGLQTRSKPVVKLKTVDMAGNESTGVTAPEIEIL